MPRTPSPSSPPRKRQRRLSSPTYDDHFPDLSHDDIAAFDAIHSLSQLPSTGNPSTPSRPSASTLHDDPDNPFQRASALPAAPLPTFSSASALRGFKLASSVSTASALFDQHERSPSPEAPPDVDYSSWFEPAQAGSSVSFQSASFMSAAAMPTELPPISLGFSKASGTGTIVPSSAALQKAREKISKIWNDADSAPQDENKPPESPFPSFAKASTSFSAPRSALGSMANNINTPATPSPSGFTRPTVIGHLTSPSVDKPIRTRPKPFKSPLLANRSARSTAYAASPLNPSRPPALSTPISTRTVPSFTPSSALAKQATSSKAGFTSPLRSPAISRRSRPAPFVTPFKPGMKLGEPGRKHLEQLQSSSTKKLVPIGNMADVGSRSPLLKPPIPVFFDLSPRVGRLNLSTCGTFPQQYDVEELELMGLNYDELSQITPTTASYYCFHTSSSIPPSSTMPPSSRLGPTAALEALLDRGCTLATQEWVDNHWSLILWKLAGLAAFEPQRERSPETKRWCWKEVIRQLRYRYERELNRGKRPPLRLVVTRDSHASLPMVLCISDIKWFPKTTDEQGRTVESYPELEVTDGWYRLRAQIDASLVRAVTNGRLRIGRKIGVVGSRLSSEKKDPVEILEGYNSNKLVLSGNSCSLVPWHTKLGFTSDNFVRTLHSLSPDGGSVCALDIVIVKTHPIAFIEFLEDEDGNRYQEGPRSAAEEQEISDKWKMRQEQEAAKLQRDLEKKQLRYEGYIDRLERKAGASFRAKDDDYAPDNLDSLYDELEDPAEASSIISRLNPNTAGWLAVHIRRRFEADRERANEEFEKELERICPPRNVKSFRVLVAEDAKTMKRPARRNVQITVWDVLQWCLSDDKPAGTFEVGHRYLVTNLNPTHQKAWMSRYEDNAEIFLSTSRGSRWIKRSCTM